MVIQLLNELKYKKNSAGIHCAGTFFDLSSHVCTGFPFGESQSKKSRETPFSDAGYKLFRGILNTFIAQNYNIGCIRPQNHSPCL